GDPAWAEVMKRSGRPAEHEYQIDKAYPDQELGLLAMQTAEVAGKPLADVLEGFGEALVPDMFKYYSILANPRWSFIDFLLGMGRRVHSASRAPPRDIHRLPSRDGAAAALGAPPPRGGRPTDQGPRNSDRSGNGADRL